MANNKEPGPDNQPDPNIGRPHIDNLDEQLRNLKDVFRQLGSSDDFDELFVIIRRPGWTTLRELGFVNALVDATKRCADDARYLRTALLEGDRAIADQS